MKTLEEAFRDSTLSSTPYSGALKVKVCGVGPVIAYRNANGEQRQSTVIGFADRTMAVKGVLYDSSKLDVVKLGHTVMLLNVIIKNETVRSLVITNRSKVLKTGPLDVPESLVTQGKEIAFPPPAAEVSIKTAQSSPTKTLVTLRGQVVSEEMQRSVRVNGEETSVRTIKVKDITGTCKVSLWRDLTKTKTSVGSHIIISDVVVQLYNDEKSVSSTVRTKIEEVTVPEVCKTLQFIAYEEEDGQTIKLTAEEDGEYPEYLVKKASLSSALKCETRDMENNLMKKLPVSAAITVKENKILTMTI
ncbi:uncharacterized protein LOC134267157 [Saccostrea cucullata]|uniref:uncharacterized protein LOC134267157 n=1 Tax=Saccostrea cuccullata TaxID=36930 RepID=UPI002ED39A48